MPVNDLEQKVVQPFNPATLMQEFIQVGTPSEKIVKAAKEWPADFVVIGSHGRGGMQRALLGSVAEP